MDAGNHTSSNTRAWPLGDRAALIGWVALRLGLAGLFLVAGALKLRDPAIFAEEIANYRLLPALAPYLAIVLPPTEIVAALVLAVGPAPWRRAAALVLALLSLLFTGAVAAAASRGLDISCACFGQGSGSVGWLTVGRNLLLTAVAVALVWRQRPSP
jgi:putative oxidoreductase